MNTPIFQNVAQAVNVLYHITARMSQLITWLSIAIAHLALFFAIALALWIVQWRPVDVAVFFQGLAHSSPLVFLAAIGVSALTVIALYWRLIKWVHRSAGGPLADYLMKGLEVE